MPSRTAWAACEGRAAPATTFSLVLALPRAGAFVVCGALLSMLGVQPAWASDARGPDVPDGGLPDGGLPNGGLTDGGSSDGELSDGRLPDVESIESPAPAAAAPPPQSARPPRDEDGPENRSTVSARRIAATAPQEDRTAAASVLIPAESPHAAEDLGSLLLEVPGANITRSGGLGSFTAVSLRGANPDEVRVFIDGVPLNQSVGGAVDLSTLPLGDVDRIEVYRGSAPIAFGQSALGGVVSISTRTPQGTHASIRTGSGSFRTMSADATAGNSVGRLRLYGGLHVLRAKGDFPDAPPAVPGGYQPMTRENSDLSQIDGVLRAAVALAGRRELRGGFIGITRDQGLAAQNIFRSDARAATTRLLAHLDYESRDDLGASSRLRAALFASATWDELQDPLHQIVGVPTATHDRTRLAGTTVTAEKALGDEVRIAGVMEGRGEDYLPQNRLNPSMPVGFPARRSVASAGVEIDVHSAGLGLDVIPSLRLEASRDVRTGRDSFGENLPQTDPTDRLLPVLRLGALRTLGVGTSLRGNVGRYARIPSFVELYGNNRGFVGSPGLRPEQGLNADVGIAVDRSTRAGVLTTSATVFGARVDDLIGWETYSSTTRAQNVSRARIWGIETELRLRARRLMVTTQATLIDARDRGAIASRYDRQLGHHPRYRAYARGEWRQPIAATAFAVSGYADADGTAGNFETTGPYSAIAPRLIVGAGLAIEHARAGLRLALSAFNVTDSRVEDFSNYPLPGRSFYVALGWSRTATPPVP